MEKFTVSKGSLFKIKLVLGLFFNCEKLGSAQLARVKARLGSARQKGGSGATLLETLV